MSQRPQGASSKICLFCHGLVRCFFFFFSLSFWVHVVRDLFLSHLKISMALCGL